MNSGSKKKHPEKMLRDWQISHFVKPTSSEEEATLAFYKSQQASSDFGVSLVSQTDQQIK